MALGILVSFSPVPVSGAGAIIGIYPPSADASSGLVTIEVNVYSVVNLQAVEFTVRYDTTKLDGVSISFTRTIPGNCGCGLFLNQTFYESAGVVTISYTLLGQQFSGSGVLAFITFRDTAFGMSALLLEDTTLVDSNAAAIPHTLSNGTVFAAPGGGGGGSRVLAI